MRLALLAIPFVLVACANLEEQTGLTAEEQCALASTALLLAEVNELAPDALARAKLNFDVFCPASMPVPEPLPVTE